MNCICLEPNWAGYTCPVHGGKVKGQNSIQTGYPRTVEVTNAVLKGVPKGFWLPLYERARKLAGGKTKKETNSLRDQAIEYTRTQQIPDAAVFKSLGISKLSEMSDGHISTLRGFLTAIRDGETSMYQVFGVGSAEKKQKSSIKEKPKAEQKEEAKGPISSDQFDQIYNLLPNLNLTMQQCIAVMKSLGHKGAPRQFPAAKFDALISEMAKAPKK